MTRGHVEAVRDRRLRPTLGDHARSKRSRFITFVQAATKSWTNFACASELPYTSARARSWEFDPKTRSTRVPVHSTPPVLRSRPSYTSSDVEEARHVVLMSRRFTKKSLVSVSGRLVKPPCLDSPAFAPSTRRPPMRTVISGAV